MRFYMAVMLGLLMALNSHSAFAKWDEERDVTGSGNQDLIYYYKINAIALLFPVLITQCITQYKLF